MFEGIDLSSDTVTRPTREMKNAMVEAPLGDEQRGEDPTTRELEQRLAEKLGKSTALFFPSATMANQIAISALCEPGDEVLADHRAHIFIAEAGGPAANSGVMARPMITRNGIFSGEDIRRHYRPSKGPLYPQTRLVSLENTTNMGGGVAWSREQVADALEASRELGLKTHLDGSRLFNACVKTGLSPKMIAERFDTVTICLSKGLGCAAGAVLAFDQSKFDKIRRLKQRMGGALRQSGILAAAGIYAMQHHVERLAEDHENASRLATGLSQVAELEIENPDPSTNMVFFYWRSRKISGSEWLARCVKKGVRFSAADSPGDLNRFRAVTHLDVRRQDIDAAVGVVKAVSSEI